MERGLKVVPKFVPPPPPPRGEPQQDGLIYTVWQPLYIHTEGRKTSSALLSFEAH